MTSDSSPTLDRILDHLRDGSYVELRAWDAVNAAMIRHWCDVLGIRNPRYVDESAAELRQDVLVAPATMLYSWVMPNFKGRYPGGNARELLREASIALGREGYSQVLAVRLEQHYTRAIVCGERLLRTSRIESVSARKSTVLGDGYFITEGIRFADQSGDPVADARMTLLCYRRSPPALVERPPTPCVGAAGNGSDWPVIRVDITRGLIVAIAVATRDYQDVHIDPDAARAAGAGDIFLNILGTAGLIQRCVEQWLGPATQLIGLDLRLLTPVYPGDRLSFSLISLKKCEDDVVNLKVSGALPRGLHVEASVTARPGGQTPE